VASVADEAGLTHDPLEGVWLDQLNHLKPRGYTFTPYWERTADPALRKAIESVIIDPNADVATVLHEQAQSAQTTLNDLK
jgi:hypothetical protein